MATLSSTTINGTGTATTDFRAPIFYDSANTGYYLDLNGTSYLYHLVLSGNTYFRPNTWVQLDGNYGIYWPNHYGLHIYPNNDGTYGSLQVKGSKNSWHGIHFDSGATLMMNSNETGVHREGYGWQFRWENGTMYCHKNSYGGGTSATVLDSSNYTNYLSSVVTGDTSSLAANATKFNIYNSNFTEQAVEFQLNSNTVVKYDRMTGSSEFLGGEYSNVRMRVKGTGFFFETVDNVWMPITCEFVEQASDINLKKDIYTITSAVDTVKQLRGVDFKWKKNDKPAKGFIAQELEQVVPEAVGEVEGTKTVDYSKIIPILTEAIKEQQTTIEQLLARIESLEGRI